MFLQEARILPKDSELFGEADAGARLPLELHRWSFWIRREIGRARRELLRTRLDLLHDFLDGAFELRILAAEYVVRAVVHLDIGSDTAVLNNPFAIDIAAVDQRDVAAYATDASPGAFANEWAQLIRLEELAEDVAVRSSVLVGNAGHVTVEYNRRHGTALPVAGGVHACEHPAQALKDQLIDEPTAVVANVDDQSLLANLGEELLDEGVQSVIAHVGDVDVADSPMGRSIHLLAIGFNHVEFAQRILI